MGNDSLEGGGGRRPRAVVFDLGGVLVELGGAKRMAEWLGGGITRDELFWRWLASPAVRRYESGRSTPEEFARDAVAELRLPVAPAAFLEHFRGWPTRAAPGALELLRALRGRVKVACLSNTSALHWTRIEREMGFAGLFDARFLSHELGMVKPDRAIFERLVRDLAVPAPSILFFDDGEPNVAAARSLGIDARLVRSVDEARRALDARMLGVTT